MSAGPAIGIPHKWIRIVAGFSAPRIEARGHQVKRGNYPAKDAAALHRLFSTHLILLGYASPH